MSDLELFDAAPGHAPTLLARHIDAAGAAGIKRWQLWDKTNRDQVWDARSMDAALAPLLASGAYEAVRRSTGGRAATVYRRVQPRQETRA